ncbi:hypothetical protein [Aquimarina aquimarini]|uniref:hypothetical protein n=1 Tax=Aquimarina aquimarini TaxID=1191734 RepID=UPI000D562B76|nr:hypothetical protein [Aquimarina aquimarini]
MNRNLGNYDMVLGLSTNKINYQFSKMYKRKIIHNEWVFLTNSMGKEAKTLTSKEAKEFWENVNINKAAYATKKDKLEAIDKQIMAELDKEDWDDKKIKELKNKKRKLKDEVKVLKEKIDEASKYDLGLIANIAAPKIEINKDNAKELTLQIIFKSNSKLFYTHEGKMAFYDLGGNGIIYAFKVAIGKVKITADKKIVEIDSKGIEHTKTLRDKGITDNDFTIQSLFLDFENANIASYDAKNSKLPSEANNNALLQAAMVNYFSNLVKSNNNPYVLGYGIHKNEVKPEERNLFYPTGVAYSTNYSEQKRASTFNFLMLLNNHSFPTGGDAGILPTSLMEYAVDKSGTINGVFGMNKTDFEKNYINLLSNVLKNKIKSSMGSKCKSASVNGRDDIHFNFGWHNVKEGSIDIEYDGIRKSNDNKYVDIIYKVKSKARVHQEIKQLFGTVGVDWSISTKGRYRKSNGHDGLLIVSLKAGTSGKLELKVNYETEFKLGFDTEEPNYKGALDKFWDGLNKILSDFAKVMFNIQTDIGKDLSNLSNIDNIGDSLNISNLQNLENKIILPVSSVYTYKNVRLLDNGPANDPVLLFDTSYGVVSQ